MPTSPGKRDTTPHRTINTSLPGSAPHLALHSCSRQQRRHHHLDPVVQHVQQLVRQPTVEQHPAVFLLHDGADGLGHLRAGVGGGRVSRVVVREQGVAAG
jgi:hypothetical protein